MSYRRYSHRSRRYNGAAWSSKHRQERLLLSKRFAGIDADIEKVFLGLKASQLGPLLQEYGRKYGQGAEAYAKATIPKWRNGSVKMSGVVAQRLLDLLPPLLPFELRLELIRKLRAHYLQPERIVVSACFEDWKSVVNPAVARVVSKSLNHNLPSDIIRVARWLANEDSLLANQLLARAEQEEAKIRTSLLNEEFARIETLATQFSQKQLSFQHMIRVPNGEILVKIAPRQKLRGIGALLRKEWTLSNSEHDPATALAKIGNTSIARRPDDNLLDMATRSLTPEDADALRRKALEAKLELDVAAREADHRFVNASRDMAGTVKMAHELDQGRNDYQIESTYETASGRTTVRVKRATNQTIAVLVAAVAIVILLIFLSQ